MVEISCDCRTESFYYFLVAYILQIILISFEEQYQTFIKGEVKSMNINSTQL